MPRARARKKCVPVTRSSSLLSAAANGSATATPERTRKLIRRFHLLLKKRARLVTAQRGPSARDGASVSRDDHCNGSEDDEGRARELREVEREMDALGGLSAYQRMSCAGQGRDRGGSTEKVLIGWLRELRAAGWPKPGSPSKSGRQGAGGESEGGASGPWYNKNPAMRSSPRVLRLLEVGALEPDSYQSCRAWIECTRIDLRSRHPAIREQDFFLMDEAEHRGQWDVISFSLVLNYVPEPSGRGRMLRMAHDMLSPEGYLFLALPLPCVLNSRYLTPSHLEHLMEFVGFVEVRHRWRIGGKMAYWMFGKRNGESSATVRSKLSLVGETFRKKTVLRRGSYRNNFSILLE